MKCPKGCGLEVTRTIHEGTMQPIYWNQVNEVPHRCNGKEYYCKECKRKISEDKPCFHRLLNWKGYKKEGLDNYY